MNVTAILSLIADLYNQITELQKERDKLVNTLADIDKKHKQNEIRNDK